MTTAAWIVAGLGLLAVLYSLGASHSTRSKNIGFIGLFLAALALVFLFTRGSMQAKIGVSTDSAASTEPVTSPGSSGGHNVGIVTNRTIEVENLIVTGRIQVRTNTAPETRERTVAVRADEPTDLDIDERGRIRVTLNPMITDETVKNLADGIAERTRLDADAVADGVAKRLAPIIRSSTGSSSRPPTVGKRVVSVRNELTHRRIFRGERDYTVTLKMRVPRSVSDDEARDIGSEILDRFNKDHGDRWSNRNNRRDTVSFERDLRGTFREYAEDLERDRDIEIEYGGAELSF